MRFPFTRVTIAGISKGSRKSLLPNITVHSDVS